MPACGWLSATALLIPRTDPESNRDGPPIAGRVHHGDSILVVSGTGPPDPKLVLSARKTGKWLWPSTEKGQLSWSVSGGTSKVVRYGSQGWLLRKVCPATCIGKSVFENDRARTEVGGGANRPRPGHHHPGRPTPRSAARTQATRKTVDSLKFVRSRLRSISWL